MATNPQAQPHPPQKSGMSIWIIVAIIFGVLLMVIAILIMMLLPAIGAVRGAARRVASQNNARQICLAIHNSDSAFMRLPTNSKDVEGNVTKSWRVQLLPYMGLQNVSDPIRDGAWDDPAIREFVEVDLPVFQSLRGDTSGAANVTHFVAVNDPSAPLYGGRVSLNSIKMGDGLGNTALLLEHVNSDIAWAEPRDVTIAEAISIIQSGGEGTVVAMADGSVGLVEPSASAEDITKLFLLGNGAAKNLQLRR